MPTTLQFVDLDDMKAFIGVASSSTDHDDELNAMALVAAKDIERVTGRFFSKQEFTELFTSRDNVRSEPDLYGTSESGRVTYTHPREYSLAGWSIDPGTPVVVTYDPTGKHEDDAVTLVEGTDFIVDYDNNKVIILTGTRYALRGLSITYTAGYDNDGGDPATLAGNTPADLRMAALFQIQHLRVRARPDNIGIKNDRTHSREATRGGPFAVRGGVCPEAQALLLDYRKVRTGKK